MNGKPLRGSLAGLTLVGLMAAPALAQVAETPTVHCEGYQTARNHTQYVGSLEVTAGSTISIETFDSTRSSDGNDYIVCDYTDSDAPVTVVGGAGDDELHGGGADDTIYGGPGRDKAMGEEGNDDIYGGLDDDWVWADYGRDTIHGGYGNDTITVGAGADVIYGEAGDDYVFVQSGGVDTVRGGPGADIAEASNNDIIYSARRS